MPHTTAAATARTGISRRTLTAGIAWAAPVVAATSAAPAYAASAPRCFPITWATASSTSAGEQNVTSDGAKIPVATGLAGTAYSYPQDPTYTPLNMNSGSGSLVMSIVTAQSSSGADRTSGYEYVRFTYPQNAVGPVTFTITNIDSYTTSQNGRGAQYFTDSVQVLSNGAVVTPTAAQNTTLNGGWLTANGTAAGAASYTIQSPGTVDIRLRNAYTGTIAAGSHPNQTIKISPVTCGTAAALPPNPTLQYRQRASQYGTTKCSSTTTYSTYNINNTTTVGTSPYGFSVVNMPASDGTMSPTTQITASGVAYVLGLPKSTLDQSKLANPFTFAAGGTSWTLDSSKTREQTMTTFDGKSATYMIYTFTFTGPTTNDSVPNGTQPTSWPNSRFSINVAGSTTSCTTLGYFWGSYTGTFTAANGGTVLYNTLPPQWNKMTAL